MDESDFDFDFSNVSSGLVRDAVVMSRLEMESKKQALETQKLILKSSAEKKQSLPKWAQSWSKRDEIRLLKGLLEFEKGGGNVHKVSHEEFFEFMQGKLQDSYNKTQFQNKIRRMRKKFRGKVKSSNAAARLKGHDLEFFKLSSKLWGRGDQTPFSPSSIVDLHLNLVGKSVHVVRDRFIVSEGYKLLNEITKSEIEEKSRVILSQMVELRTASTLLYNQMMELSVNALSSKNTSVLKS